MGTDISDAGGPAYYTVGDAAWILGVTPSTVLARCCLSSIVGQLLVVAGAAVRHPPSRRLASIILASSDDLDVQAGWARRRYIRWVT